MRSLGQLERSNSRASHFTRAIAPRQHLNVAIRAGAWVGDRRHCARLVLARTACDNQLCNEVGLIRFRVSGRAEDGVAVHRLRFRGRALHCAGECHDPGTVQVRSSYGDLQPDLKLLDSEMPGIFGVHAGLPSDQGRPEHC